MRVTFESEVGMGAAIRTEGLSKRFGAVEALSGLDLCVEQGEVLGYLGPNGAGKTTTIRLLLDLARPSAGRAEIFGLDTHRDAVAVHRRVAYVPGEATLWPLLRSPLALAVRLERATWSSWAVGLAVMSFLFGIVASAVASTSSTALEEALARLGAGDAGVPAYLGLFYLIIGAALALAAAGHVAATREEEADGHADTLLVGPVRRIGWLGGRLAVSVGALGGLALIAGVGGWAGSASQHGGVSLMRVMGAALNTLPAALLVLGAGTLAHGLAPRRAAALSYALVAWSFVVEMLGATGTGGRLLLDLSVFHHVALVPAAEFRANGAVALLGLGVAGMLAGIALFRRRDLAGV